MIKSKSGYGLKSEWVCVVGKDRVKRAPEREVNSEKAKKREWK